MGNFDVEIGFLSSLLFTRDICTVKENQITREYLSGENKTAFDFIQEHVIEFGEVPTYRIFEKEFPNIELEFVEDENGEFVVGTEENLLYWCGELRKKLKHNVLALMTEDIADRLNDFADDEACAKLRETLVMIENEIEKTDDINITQNTKDRIDSYLERKNNKGIRGIVTGIELFDHVLGGLEEETLVVILALTGVGKTWLEVLIGASCMLQNVSVLQVITEMSTKTMQERYDAFLYYLCYGDIDYKQYKSGTMPLKTERKFFHFLENDVPRFEPLYLCTATSPLGVSAAIDKYEPDVVLIDSVYLMDDDQGAKDDWLRVAHITRDLKRLAKIKKKPIVVNTQADKTVSKKTGPEIENIMFTQAIGQDADDIVALWRNDMMKNDGEMGMKSLKRREGDLTKGKMYWEFSPMNFSSIYGETPDSKNSDAEMLNEDDDTTIDI